MDKDKSFADYTAAQYFNRAESLYHSIKDIEEDISKLGEYGSMAYELIVAELSGEILDSGKSITGNDLKTLMVEVNLEDQNNMIEHLEYMKNNKKIKDKFDTISYYSDVGYVIKYYNNKRKQRVSAALSEDEKYEIEIRLQMGDDFEEKIKKEFKKNKVNVENVKSMFRNFFEARLLKVDRTCKSTNIVELMKESDLDEWMKDWNAQTKIRIIKNHLEGTIDKKIEHNDNLLNYNQSAEEMVLVDDIHDELEVSWVKDAIELYESLEG